jgi:DNA polymerase III delta subunit
VETLDIANAIAENNKQSALRLIGKFLNQQNQSEEKAAIIHLNALLAEQFRNIYMIQDFLSRKISEKDILEKTAWKTGRLFVIKKIASKFSPKKVMEFLNKLQFLDEELKTSSTPPKVLLDLIVSQLF